MIKDGPLWYSDVLIFSCHVLLLLVFHHYHHEPHHCHCLPSPSSWLFETWCSCISCLGLLDLMLHFHQGTSSWLTHGRAALLRHWRGHRLLLLWQYWNISSSVRARLLQPNSWLGNSRVHAWDMQNSPLAGLSSRPSAFIPPQSSRAFCLPLGVENLLAY